MVRILWSVFGDWLVGGWYSVVSGWWFVVCVFWFVVFNWWLIVRVFCLVFVGWWLVVDGCCSRSVVGAGVVVYCHIGPVHSPKNCIIFFKAKFLVSIVCRNFTKLFQLPVGMDVYIPVQP